MRAVGHGIDLVEVETNPQDEDPAWLDRCFSAREREMLPVGPTRAAHIAGRFAAKEAVLKALGTGQGDGISFADVEIERLAGDPPTVVLTNRAREVAHAAGISKWLLSISHTGHLAMASAIALTA